MKNFKKEWIKIFLGIAAGFLFRIIPIRPPNIEPILALQMPFAKTYGAGIGFAFSFFSILIYDFFTGTVGQWTFITSLTYGTIGIAAALYFKNRASTAFSYAGFAVIATLFFDAVTGLTIGPLFFHQPLKSAFIGQIPFTFWHLIGNVSFALVLSPAVYNLLNRS